MSDWFDPEPFFTPHRSRKEIAAEQLARLVTPDNSDPPLVAARKKREAAERLKRHDAMFGVYPGCTLGAESPRWEAGDDQARED